MNINLRYDVNTLPQTLEDVNVSTIEELVDSYKGKLRYKIYAARKNNRVVMLSEKLEDGDKIVFLDLRDESAKQIYQDSMISLYIKAVTDEMPGAEVLIRSSLNRGIFTNIKKMKLSDSAIEQIENRMKAIAKANLPFREIDAETELTVPSTGYLKEFALKECRGGIVLRIAEDTHPGGLAKYVDNKNLHMALDERRKWSNIVGIRYIHELNEHIENGTINDIIQVSEALQEKNIVNIAEEITEQKKRIILITGPSSSGKTSFAHRLCTQLWVLGHKPIYLGTDDYYLERDKVPFQPDGTKNFENLDSLDVELFNKQMNALLNGEEVDIPRFDFNLGKKVFGERFEKLAEGQPIVIEGIHGLNDELTKSIPAEEKYKIYISPLIQIRVNDRKRIALTDVRKLRRIVRDANKRGWGATETMKNWRKVREGEDKNVFPYNDSADVFFNTSYVYELAALKKYAEPILEAVPENDEFYTEARRLLGLLAPVRTLEDDTIIPNNSILREFIGGSAIV